MKKKEISKTTQNHIDNLFISSLWDRVSEWLKRKDVDETDSDFMDVVWVDELEFEEREYKGEKYMFPLRKKITIK